MLLLAALISTASAQVEPHESFYKLPTANGWGVAIFNERSPSGAVVDRFSDHIYQQYNEASEPVRDLLYDSYFGLREGGVGGWLTESVSYRMVEGTNLIEVVRLSGDLEVTEFVWLPMALEAPAMVAALRVKNVGAEASGEVEAFSLLNFHVGDETSESEAVSVESGGRVVEWGQNTSLRFDHIPLRAPDGVGCSPDNPWVAVNEGRDLTGCADNAGDDRVVGMQWDLGSLQPGEEAWVGQVSHFGLGLEVDLATPVSDWVAGRSVGELVAAEQAWWASWQGEGQTPDGMSAEESAVYAQALAFLKMGQVREPGRAYGQVLASMPLASDGTFSHLWNIAWVRDGAYGIAGLVAAGHLEEARAALAFQIQDDSTGAWRDYVGGYDHALSICRIYGEGSEWTDDDGTGPNIEFDNFGLYLWAFGTYLRASEDWAFLESSQGAVLDRTADVLVGLIDPETGLIVPDSSIWERHWNGNQKRFTYTSTWAVRGLREAAWMAERLGETERAWGYRDAAAGIAAAIEAELIREDGVLVGNLEEHLAGEPALDLAAVDAFNNGTLDPSGEAFTASMLAWEASLGMETGPGFARNDDGDLYDLQEWVMIDLRVAEAQQRAGRVAEAEAIDAWITAQAQENRLIIPELLSVDAADYAGPAPMMGFGSGLYAWRMATRGDLSVDEVPEVTGGDTGLDTGGGDDTGGDDTGDTGGDDTGDSGEGPWADSGAHETLTNKGCACASGGGGAGGGLMLAIALISLGYRRNSA